MGYEVLDTTGAAGGTDGRPASPPSPDDVVDLESLPLPPPEQPRTSGRWPVGRRGLLLAAGLATTAVVIGVSWGEHRSDLQRRSDADVRVLAVAQPPNMAQYGRFSAASIRVSVMNLGDAPVDIVTSWPGTRPTAGTTLVGLATGNARVQPGRAQQAVVVVGISCVDRVSVVPRLQVRTLDGETHPVEVRDDDLESYQVRPGQVCGLPDGMPLAASVTGSIRAPILLLRNGTEHPLRVGIDPDSAVQLRAASTGHVQHSTRVGAIGPALSISTDPGLPVVVPAGGTKALGLGVQVRGCSVQPSLRRLAYVSLLGEAIAVEHYPPPDVSAGVDISALVGAELAQICN